TARPPPRPWATTSRCSGSPGPTAPNPPATTPWPPSTWPRWTPPSSSTSRSATPRRGRRTDLRRVAEESSILPYSPPDTIRSSKRSQVSSTESPVSGAPGRRRKPPASTPQERSGRSRGTRRRRGGRRATRRFPLVPVLVGVLVVAVIALAVVVVMRFTGPGTPETVQAMPSRYQVYEAGQANELLADRDDDPRPFTEHDFFPEGDTDISSRELTFTLQAQDISENCTEAVWGPRALAAVESADCSQVVRAGYVSDEHIGVAAVFKLRDVEAARTLAEGLAPAEEDTAEEAEGGFLVPPASQEPFNLLGSGYSSAEATVNGHYLV